MSRTSGIRSSRKPRELTTEKREECLDLMGMDVDSPLLNSSLVSNDYEQKARRRRDEVLMLLERSLKDEEFFETSIDIRLYAV